jgi:alpha-2-macroglobulin
MNTLLSRPAPVLATVVLAVVGLYAAAFSAEQPVGSLRGRLVAEGSAQPLAGVSITVRPKTPKDGSDSRYLETDGTGGFELRRLAAGTYEIEPLSQAHENRSVAVVVREGEVAAAEVRLKPGEPYLNLNVHQHAFLPDESPKVALQGFRQGDDVRMRLLSVETATTLLDNGSGLRSLLTPVSTTGRQGRFRNVPRSGVRVLREWTHPVREKNGEGVFYDYEKLETLRPGIYLVEAHGSANNAMGWLVVTDLALVTKSVKGRVLAMAADLRTGVARPAAALTVFHGTRQVAAGTTDSRGVAQVQVTGAPGDTFEAIARQGTSLAFSRFFPFGYGGEGGERYRVSTYTDRPVYRPGHRVRFKGVVRRLEGIGYGVPSPDEAVEVTVSDEQGNTVHEERLTLNGHGSFNGELQLPVEALTGSYNLAVKVEGETHADSFAVASYRKPEWRVEVETAKKSWVRGERVPVTVRAHYYFGAPVAEGKVTYTVYRSQRWTWWDGEEDTVDEEETGRGLYGEVVTSGEAVTDADGAARFEIATDQNQEEGWTGDYDYSVEAEVRDLSDRFASGKATVRVAAGEITLDARPSRYVAAPGETVNVEVRARNLEDQPAAGVTLHAVTVLQRWTGGKSQEQQLDARDVRTDAQGRVEVPLTLPREGLVAVRLSTADARGNKIEVSADVWVSTAEGGDYGGSYPALSVIPDRKLYRVGDTAQLLLNTDKPGASAMVALEAERVLEYRIVPLKSKSTVVRFKIQEGYEPNVFVTACFVKHREFVSNQARLNVNAEAHRLDVRIESDRAVYRPGEMATFRVRTAAGGRPVPAEVSLGLVDEAVYAIREDRNNVLWNGFYPRRRNAVLTEFSYPEIYLGDASKDDADVALRRSFPDTAHWAPVLRTDASGQASVRIRLPDSLTSWRATAIGHTDGTEVGQGTHNVQVQKELTLRLQVPRSLTEGDRLTLSAVVHNYTAGPLDTRVSLRAVGLRVSGDARRVRLAPGGAERVTWEAVASAAGRATVAATAAASGFTDGIELAVPVVPFARQAVHYRTGAVTGEAATEEFPVDPNAVSGEVELRVAPTLAGAILGSLDYLATYPHGCTEQTMSSFLPDVVILQLMKGLGLRKPELENRLPEMTRAGLLRLYRYQHQDGGWGWWEYDESEPWMTAYVLFGMLRARSARIEVNPGAFQNGLDSARNQAKAEKLKPDDGTFLAYVLAEAGEKATAKKLLARFEKGVEKLHRRSLGYRALALAALDDAESRSRGEAAMADLWSLVESNSGLFSWSEVRTADSYGLPQDVESTAVVLKAALALTPEDPRLAGVVRWLLLKRSGNQWESTRDTAWILFALADYLKQTGELSPDYQVEVLLNGQEIFSRTMTPADALAAEQVIRVPVRGLPSGRLEVRKTGAGTVYYSLKVTQDVPAATFAAESSVPGLEVEREYYRLETRRDGSGRLSVLPEKRPTTHLKVGDRILARLRIRNSRPLEYVMIESPLPSGCEVQERGDVPYEEWHDSGYWWSHQDVRDDRINLFIRSLPAAPAGRPHVIEYYLRPEMSGEVRALPAVLSDMYVPGLRASSAESRLEVGK